MSIKKKWLTVILGICFVAAAQVAIAETGVDVRVKLGSAAGVDTVEFSNNGSSNISQESSGNFQIEVAFTPQQGPVNFVGTVGVFGRNHKGQGTVQAPPDTDVDYSAGGLSGSAGISIKADENFHFEGRFELALGSGKPTLSSPAPWPPVKEGSYAATSLIFGGYYTISNPGLQIGLELGAQSFVGNFQILNAGFWEDAKVKGSGGTANLVIGYRF
jgi:hypothetical protein